MTQKYRNVLLAIALSSLAGWFVGCKNDISGPGGSNNNLVTNPSFEADSWYLLDGWHMKDTLLDTIGHFSNDVPILGGNWSLDLVPKFSPEEGWADYYIVGPVDNSVYKLSIWAKQVGNWDGGSVRFQVRTAGSTEERQATEVTSENWQYYTLEDTLRLYENDTLVLRLSAGSGNPDQDDGVLFDEVLLQRFE